MCAIYFSLFSSGECCLFRAILGVHSRLLHVALGNRGCVEGQTGVYRIAEEHMSPDIFQEEWSQFFFFFLFVCVGRVPDPTSHFPPDLILYVNLVALGTT